VSALPAAKADSPASPVLRADTLADTMLILLALTLVQRLVGFGRSVLLCRWLDPEQLGQWDMAFGFLILAAPAAVLGLPGSFRRYVEHYRQQGQLRSFLRQTTLFTALLTVTAVAAIDSTSVWFSRLVFGRDDCVQLVRISAAGLALVIAYNVLIELFSSLRLFRFVSILQFAHSVLFAGVAAALVLWWRSAAESVIIAYALACLACSVAAVLWLRGAWEELPAATRPLSQRTLLTKLMPFAIWVWATDWLTNVFDIVARYMIVHHSGMHATEALVQVGNYHSARVVPVLLVTVAGMLASAALPHLSHDWERGDRRSVSAQINLMFKLITLGLMAGGVAILLAEPLLFDVAFGGKYAGGRAILPITLTACVWFGVLGIAQNYLWCAERAMLGSLAILVGVLLNIVLAFVLLPRYGLPGAVAATATANLAALGTAYLLGMRCGLQFDPGVWIVLALPPLFCLGPWIALIVLVATAAWGIKGRWILSREEKDQLLEAWRHYVHRLRTIIHPLASSR
jgi:O-antigen/teichoic acid export membrane protein